MSARLESIVGPGQSDSSPSRSRARFLALPAGLRRRVLEVAFALAAGWGISLLLETISPWHSLTASIENAGFDPARTDLIAAWIAAVAAATVAAALSRNVSLGTLCGAALFIGAYEVSWTSQQLANPPNLPGLPVQLVTEVLVMNLVTMASVGVVLSFIAAATGHALSLLVVGAPRTPSRGAHSRLAWAWRGVAILLLVGSAATTVSGIDPLIRYGPDHRIYVALPAAPAPASGPVTPGSIPPIAISGRGRLVNRTYASHAMGGPRPFAVYLPPGYSASSSYRYTLLVLLHGDPGSYRDWGQLGIQNLLDAAISRGLIPPLIAVMPDGNGKVTGAAQWANRRDGRDQVESSVLELLRLIDHDYRTLTDPGHRLLAGLSSGGFGAANLAARNPDQFSTAISLSGYFIPPGLVFGSDQAYIAANSPFDLVRNVPSARTIDYLLVAGVNDAYFRRLAERFAAELLQLGVRHTLRLLPGAHQSRVWTAGLLLSLEQLKAGIWPVAAKS